MRKLGDAARRNLGPIPEELHHAESDQKSDQESDFDSDISMAVQQEIDTLSQELEDLTGRVNNPL